MKGSGAVGNKRRAAPRSPPCSIGAASTGSPWDIMAVTLTLLALLIELMVGYPDRLLRAIGHPVIWIGRLIDVLDHSLNSAAAGSAARRTAGILAVAILIGAVGVLA